MAEEKITDRAVHIAHVQTFADLLDRLNRESGQPGEAWGMYAHEHYNDSGQPVTVYAHVKAAMRLAMSAAVGDDQEIVNYAMFGWHDAYPDMSRLVDLAEREITGQRRQAALCAAEEAKWGECKCTANGGILETCGACGGTWCATCTPVPAGRCHYEELHAA